MGVLSCARTGCDEIMCNYIVNGVYLCTDCLSDLEELNEQNPNIPFQTFLDTDKRKQITVSETLETLERR